MAKSYRIMISGILSFLLAALAARAGDSHTFDGKHDTSTIDLSVVYLVPKDRSALVDWRERVDYYTRRLVQFHARESSGKSSLNVKIHPEPLVVSKTAEEIRGHTPDETFFNATGEAKEALKWPPAKREGFPILLVLSEINWRELDDFTRLRTVGGESKFEGNLSEDGRHFPGAESGGARAIYDADKGLGMGLVSADGWRVPYSGSDCVVYHEGVGHAIGLPHPEPGDDSVMCFAQYHFWINQTWVTPAQKTALGWPGGDQKAPPDRSGTQDLFTAFTALQTPIVPKANEPVALRLQWPEKAKLQSIRVRVQTELRGPWLTLPGPTSDALPESVPLGSFDRFTPVSYRVDAVLADGQKAEIWGYFQVK